MNVGDAFDANKGNRTAVQLYIDYRRDCKTLATSVALYPGRAGKIKPEHKNTSKTNASRFGSQTDTDNSARAESAQDNSASKRDKSNGDICLNFAPLQFCCYDYLYRIAICHF